MAKTEYRTRQPAARVLSRQIVGWTLVMLIIASMIQKALSLAGDDWTSPNRDEQANREWEGARLICCGWATLGVIAVVPIGVWAYRKGRYG